MDRAAPECLEFFGKDDGLVEVPSAGRPIRAGDANADRTLGWEDSAHRVEHFEREPHPILERTAILVLAAIGQGREKLVQQVSVCAVELNRIESQPCSPRSGRGEPVANARQPGPIERDGRVLTVGKRDRRWRDGLPSVGLRRRNLRAPFPRHPC